MKKVTLITLALAAILVVGAASFAAGPGRGPGQDVCYGGNPQVLSQLNLTAEQTGQIQVLREAHQKDIKPLRDQIFIKRGDLRLLWAEKNPDQARIKAAQKEMDQLRSQMAEKMTDHWFAVMKVLTPEQKEKMQGLKHGRGLMPHQGRAYFEGCRGPAGADCSPGQGCGRGQGGGMNQDRGKGQGCGMRGNL